MVDAHVFSYFAVFGGHPLVGHFIFFFQSLDSQCQGTVLLGVSPSLQFERFCNGVLVSLRSVEKLLSSSR